VLGYTPDHLLETAVENRMTLTVFILHQAQLLSQHAAKLGATAVVHLKVETGFNRLGSDDIPEMQ
jgi:alanine racemase